MNGHAPQPRNHARAVLGALCSLAIGAASPPAIEHGPEVGHGKDKALAQGASATSSTQTADAPAAMLALASRMPAGPLVSIAHSDRLVWTGIVLAPDGRIFTCYPRITGNAGPSLATLGADGTPVAYPGGGWNSWNASDRKPDPAPSFVGVSAIRLAADNALWVVDSGVAIYGKPALPHAAKLVRFDLATNGVSRILELPPDVLRPRSLIANMRLNGAHAYLTDSGAPGLIVIDLTDGSARRVLDGDPATTAQRPVIVDGAVLKGADNKPVMIHAAVLEVSPDGQYLYFQPAPGPLYRIPTALLDDPKATPQQVAARVSFWYDTPTLGGSAIGPDGTLYLEDVENDSVLALSDQRALRTLQQDPRLHWPAEPFLKDGALILPVSQLDRIGAFHHGKPQMQFPLQLFSLRVAAAAPVVHTGRP